jgi:hypothetical protein
MSVVKNDFDHIKTLDKNKRTVSANIGPRLNTSAINNSVFYDNKPTKINNISRLK